MGHSDRMQGPAHPPAPARLLHGQNGQPSSARSSGPAELPSHLRIVKQLGRGAYGTVHLCEDTRSQQQVAVKHVRHAAKHGKSILREIRLLSRLYHDNLLHIIDFPAVSGPDFDDVFIVLPYMPSDLHKVIQSRQALTEKHVQVIMCQILRALSHLHAAGVAHRDLKPANILISSDCRLKVCDFGLARGDMNLADGGEDEQACGVLTEYVITRWYRAPEVMLLPKQYTSAIDIWSVGCILGEILGRKALFPGKNHIDMVCRVAQILGSPGDEELAWLPKDSDAYRFLRNVCPPSEGVPLSKLYPMASPACLDLAANLLRWDPGQRLTADAAQEHEYLRNYFPKEPLKMPEPFDWTFDGFKATTRAVQDRLYRECARFHPEILERDGMLPASKSSSKSSGYPSQKAPATGTPVMQTRSTRSSPSMPKLSSPPMLPKAASPKMLKSSSPQLAKSTPPPQHTRTSPPQHTRTSQAGLQHLGAGSTPLGRQVAQPAMQITPRKMAAQVTPPHGSIQTVLAR